MGRRSQQPLETVAFRRASPSASVGPAGSWSGVTCSSTRRPSTLTPRRLVAGPDGESMEPGVPRVGVAERAHAPPGGDERFLHRVLGAVPVAEDEGGDGVLARRRRSHQAGERLEVAPDRPFHELSLHDHHRCVAADLTAFRLYVGPRDPNGSLPVQIGCGISAGSDNEAATPTGGSASPSCADDAPHTGSGDWRASAPPWTLGTMWSTSVAGRSQ